MKMWKLVVPSLVLIFLISLLFICKTEEKSLYLPDKGVWLFMGQDLDAVGGMDKYSEGYVDYIGVPSGVTIYTGIKTLNGIDSVANWGGGDGCGQYYLDDETFDDVMIAIGLYMVDDLQNTIDGKLKENIKHLGDWIKNSGRPVFLRIGYEFDGDWNRYDPELYKEAFRVVVNQLRSMKVNNVLSVWQSSGYKETEEKMMRWYPGDDYVDWLGYSYFDHKPNTCGIGIRAIARKKKKPVMIAEVTPRGWDMLVQDGPSIWERWFIPFMTHVHDNSDVVKAVAYINQRWTDQPMWKDQGWGDTRIQANDYIRSQWVKEMKSGFWIHRSLNQTARPFVPPENLAELQMVARPSDIDTINVFEAEVAILKGNAKQYEDPQASSDSGVAYIGNPGDGVWFENLPSAKEIAIRYASPHSGKIGIYLNKRRAADFVFVRTGSWVTSYHTIRIKLALPKGAKLGIQFDEGDKSANIDYIKLD